MLKPGFGAQLKYQGRWQPRRRGENTCGRRLQGMQRDGRFTWVTLLSAVRAACGGDREPASGASALRNLNVRLRAATRKRALPGLAALFRP